MKKKKKQAFTAPVKNKLVSIAPIATGQNDELTSAYDDSSPKLKKIFFASLLAMLAIIWFTGYNGGYHFDEMDMNNYCKDNYAWYFSGGKDTSFLSAAVANVISPLGFRKDTLLRYYGSAFDYLPVGFNKIAHIENGKNEFNVRHIFNEFFAILCIMFAGLVAVKVSGWRAAVFTQWLLFLTPTFFGVALFNTKDIPFAAGYAASLYFIILFLEELPSPSWKTILCMILAFAFTMGVRIGGALSFFYLFLFAAIYFLTKKGLRAPILKNKKQLLIKIAVLIVSSLLLVVVTWPFVLRDPFHNLLEAMNVVSKFPLKVAIIFEGEFTSSLAIPSYYLPKYMFITIPVFIIVGFFISLVFLRNKDINKRVALLVLFAFIFPVLYAIKKEAALYNSWRHFTFVYPCIVIIAGVGLNEIMKLLPGKWLQFGFILVCIAGMAKPVIWSIKNHPYEYTYFNEVEGGFQNAFYNYETDYWSISVKNGIDWLFKHEPVAKSKDTITLVSNAPLFADYYIKENYPTAKIKVADVGFKNRSLYNWTYGVFSSIYLTQSVIETDYPPYGLIHAIDIDGLPETMIIKDTARYDLLGVVAVSNYQFDIADSFFHIYDQMGGRNNGGLYGYRGIIAGMKGDVKSAMDYGMKGIKFSSTVYSGYLAVGIAYLRQGNIESALPYLQNAYVLSSKNAVITGLYKQMYPPLIGILEARLKSGK